MERHDDAMAAFRRVVAGNADTMPPHMSLAACAALTGDSHTASAKLARATLPKLLTESGC